MQWDYEVGSFIEAAEAIGDEVAGRLTEALVYGYLRQDDTLDEAEDAEDMWFVWCAANRFPFLESGHGILSVKRAAGKPPGPHCFAAFGLYRRGVPAAGHLTPGQTEALRAGLERFSDDGGADTIDHPENVEIADPSRCVADGFAPDVHYTRFLECMTWLRDFVTDHVVWSEDRGWLEQYPRLVRKA